MIVYQLFRRNPDPNGEPIQFGEFKHPGEIMPGESVILERKAMWQVKGRLHRVDRGVGQVGLMVEQVAERGDDGVMRPLRPKPDLLVPAASKGLIQPG